MTKTGNKTRKIDNAIQDFFNNGIAYLYNGRTNIAGKHQGLFDMFVKRIESEHKGQGYTYNYGNFDGVWCFKIVKHNL